MILEKMPEEGKPFDAVIIPCFTSDRRVVILQKRPNHPIYPKLWGFPAGKVRAGESILEAASREIFEETGNEIPVGLIRSTGLILSTRHKKPSGELFYFWAHILSLSENCFLDEIIINVQEHIGYEKEHPENIILDNGRAMIEDARETFRMFCELKGIATKAT